MADGSKTTMAGDDAARQHDAEDVGAALQGDLVAFDRLITRYQRRAVAVSYRLLGSIQDAQDVCQNAFVKAFKALDSLNDPERFGPWLMRIVSNLSLNFRRDRKRNVSLATVEGDGGVFEADVVADGKDVDRPSLAMETREHEAEVGRAMDALPEKQRLALVLFAIEGMSQKEVAEVMECSVEMVKWNVFQARKTLKETLSHLLEE